MTWIFIIVAAFAVEFLIRYLTRDMEDKKKREKILSLLWLGFGVILIVVWLIMK